MLPEGGKRKFYYLSIDFARDPLNPKDEIHQQEVQEKYPQIKALGHSRQREPQPAAQGAITVRMHSVGGWGAITTGKNLAMTLFELLGWDIKANPKYGSEKKGQPTTYYLSAAPEPIRINCEYTYVDVVLSPDPNVFGHSNPLSGLKKGGVFIIQSNLGEETWANFPLWAQKFIVDNEIHVFYIDAFQVAREEAGSADLQLRMQGIAFQGAFFAASPTMKNAGLTESALFAAIETQLQSKFGNKGARVVQDNLRIVRRGFDEIVEITDKPLVAGQLMTRKAPSLPIMLKALPEGDGRISDVHRFWDQTGAFYASGRGSDNLADPHMALSLMPASTGVYRDMTQIRFEYPKFLPENCTACGSCFSICPDSAIPGLVNKVSDVFATAISRVERGMPTQYLRRETRNVEKRLRELVETAGESADMRTLMDQAVLETLAAFSGEPEQKAIAEKEFGLMMEALGDTQFAITKPYWTNREKKQKGSGGLFSITVNPYTCKGCMECIEVCNDGALIAEPQTTESIQQMQNRWAMWLDLPTTDPDFIRIEDLDDKVGALETLLLDKTNYQSMVSGDGSCMGCGEKTAVHLFTATVTALMQSRVKKHLAEIDDLINRLETHIRLKLASGMDLSNSAAIAKALDSHKDADLTLSGLSAELVDRGTQPVDPDWLKWVTGLAPTWAWSTQPAAPRCGAPPGPSTRIPSPGPRISSRIRRRWRWGLFEGHMAKMAEGFKAVRMAEKELAGDYLPGPRRGLFQPLYLEQILRRRMAAVPAGRGFGRRRRDVRHRLPEPLARHDVRHAGQGAGGRYAGVFQHRRPGLHLGLHLAGFGHGALMARRSAASRRPQGISLIGWRTAPPT
jgi:pyruvate-ferredoxin/flavodoxin oxidoreductase